MDSNTDFCNMIMNMYMRFDSIEDARRVFDRLKQPDVVSWGTMIMGCILHEHGGCALVLFDDMQDKGVVLNTVMLLGLSKACLNFGLQRAFQAHDHIVRYGLETDMILGSSLIDVYNKLGIAKLEGVLKSDSNTCYQSPIAQRTDCCFEVLEEMCQKNLPFSPILHLICNQLRRATYCSFQDSNPKERPYFELTQVLEDEVEQMQAENLSWKSTLLTQHRELMTTRGELQEIGNELAKADTSSSELVEKLSLSDQAMTLEKEKVKGLHEKIKSLKKELKEVRHEVKHAQQIEATKEKELEEYEKLKASYMQLVHEFQHAQAFLHAAQCEVAESASKKDLIAAKAEILELENKISQVRAQVETFAFETHSLTPRPQWGRQVPGMDKPSGVSTAQQIEKICRENAFLAASASRLQINFAATELNLAEV
ncbi:hypothetical protein L7F22_046359 [Adiantum nelumboides]|nr:hypothetical protein [Adiantum nelumboides]